MTVQSTATTPVLIQSSKLIEWLLNRKLLQKDYPKRLVALEDQVEKLIETLPDSVSFPSELPSTYMACSQTFDTIQRQDTQTDFFGRASHSVRSWRDIVDAFKKQNVHVAEVSEALQELASVSVPKCKAIIADEQKHITDLRQKIKEYTIAVSKQEDMVDKAFKEFSISLDEPQVKLRLLEQATQVFPQLNEIVNNLKDLAPAVELYEMMTNYIRSTARSGKDKNSDLTIQCCPTLKLLMETGHVRLYTWQTGRMADPVGPDDDWVPEMLQRELESQQPPDNPVLHSDADTAALSPDQVQLDEAEIVWGESEIDFGIVEDNPDVGAIEIDVDVEVDNGNDSELKSVDGTLAHAEKSNEQQLFAATADTCSGKRARFLLDTVEGRTELLNDFAELSAFLGRFAEDLVECQDAAGAVGDKIRTGSQVGATGGSIALQQMIMQNAPSRLQSVSSKEVYGLLGRLESLHAQLSDSSLSQLLTIRSKPGYLDRLVARLTELRNQVERSKRRVAEAQLQISEAMAEQEIQTAALMKHRANCKILVALLEEEISKMCNRPVQIIGQVLNL